MDIIPIWKDKYYETTANTLEYRILISGGTEIFHGRAVRSPSSDRIRIKLNDCCKNYLNSVLPYEYFEVLVVSGDTKVPMEAYREFVLETLDDFYNTWGEAYAWAFTNDSSYEERGTHPYGSMSEPINGLAAPGQILPFTFLNENDTPYTLCYE